MLGDRTKDPGFRQEAAPRDLALPRSDAIFASAMALVRGPSGGSNGHIKVVALLPFQLASPSCKHLAILHFG